MGNVTLECRNLTKSFGGVHAVDRISVPFEAGKITALIGPNGAGKTTLFHLISGILRADSGEISYLGRRIDSLAPWRVGRMGIGRLFQEVRSFNKLTVMENVLVARREQAGENPLRSVFRRPVVRRQESENIARASRWLEIVGLDQLESARAEELSFGQQKLLALARLFHGEGNVFLLDEPTAGLNPVMVQSIIRLIRLQAKQGKTVVVIEHNMSVVAELADWVYFMDEGQIVAFGLPDEVLGDRSVRAAYLGL
jgi:ABC-type branched-subunit amino acid transport system ATPase component